MFCRQNLPTKLADRNNGRQTPKVPTGMSNFLIQHGNDYSTIQSTTGRLHTRSADTLLTDARLTISTIRLYTLCDPCMTLLTREEGEAAMIRYRRIGRIRYANTKLKERQVFGQHE
jgi:hypothetical protein